MTATNKLALELLQNAAANQTLANITFAQLNQLVQASVTDKDLTAPPGTPGNESLFIVGPSATGAWAGKDGQLAYWLSATGVWQFVAPKSGWEVAVIDEVDANGQPIRYSYNGSSWGVAAGGGSGGGMTNPMTTIRDMIVAGVGGSPTRLAGPSSEGMVLTRIGNALAWALATGFANPMTAAGDLIVGSTSGSASRFGIGTAGQVLTVVAGALAWVTPSGGGGGGSGDFKSDGSVTMTGPINEAPSQTINLSTATLDLATTTANTVNIGPGGGSSITSLGTMPAGTRRVLRFTYDGVLFTNNAAIIIPGGANISSKANDTAQVLSLGSGNWLVLQYTKIDGTALVGPPLDFATGRGYIDGLIPTWNSATSLSLSAGSAYIPGLAKNKTLAAPLTLSGLSLTASTWYYLYLYDNAGTAALELVTTAPAAPYSGNAMTKNGDTSRRFVFAVKTNASGGLMRFQVDSSSVCNYLEDVTAAPFLVLNAGAAATPTLVSMSGVVPVTSRTAKVAVINAGAPTAFIYTADGMPNLFFSCSPGARTSVTIPTNASQQMAYGHGTATGASLFLDVQGYGMER